MVQLLADLPPGVAYSGNRGPQGPAPMLTASWGACGRGALSVQMPWWVAGG